MQTLESRVYKLTTKDKTTYNKTLWGENITHTAPGTGNLCTHGWLHAYTSAELAVFVDPIHGQFGKSALLWAASGTIGISDNGLKIGCKSLTTLYQIPLPTPTLHQRSYFAIKCAHATKQPLPKIWQDWADSYIIGKSAADAASATYATRAAAYAADAAARAAYTAARAAYAAADAAYAADAAAYAAAYAARAAAYAADAAARAATYAACAAAYAAYATDAAAYAAYAAASAAAQIDFDQIAKDALAFESKIESGES